MPAQRNALPVLTAVPLLYFAGLFLAGLGHPGYNHLTQQPSELGAVGAPWAPVFNGLLAAAGVAGMVGGVRLHQALRRLGTGRFGAGVAAVLMAMGGAYLVAVAWFPLPDPRHYAVTPLALAAVPTPFVVAGVLWRHPAARRFCVAILAVGTITLGVLALNFGVWPTLLEGRQGLWSRVWAAGAFLWLAGLDVELRRMLAVNR